MAESLLQKKKDTVVEKEKKCIVTPSIEVAILHNANPESFSVGPTSKQFQLPSLPYQDLHYEE